MASSLTLFDHANQPLVVNDDQSEVKYRNVSIRFNVSGDAAAYIFMAPKITSYIRTCEFPLNYVIFGSPTYRGKWVHGCFYIPYVCGTSIIGKSIEYKYIQYKRNLTIMINTQHVGGKHSQILQYVIGDYDQLYDYAKLVRYSFRRNRDYVSLRIDDNYSSPRVEIVRNNKLPVAHSKFNTVMFIVPFNI